MIFISLPDAMPAQQRCQREYDEFMPPPAIIVAASGDATGAAPIEIRNEPDASRQIEITLPVSEWTNALEREFQWLAVTSATGNSNAGQDQRLASLQATRRRLVYPRTTLEIIAEYRARQTTRELADALQKYVRLRNAKTDPWISAKTNVQQSHISKGD